MSTLIEVKNLIKHFTIGRSLLFRSGEVVHAVDGVTFNIKRGEIFGLVGESGCGKTTTGKLTLYLYPPTSGEVEFKGKNIFELGKDDLLKFRRETGIIFQDPFASLNPRKTIFQTLRKSYMFGGSSKGEVEELVLERLESVGLHPAREFLNRYPHELSGGQRQRVVVARAIGPKTTFIIADEPVASIDISLRAQIINFIKEKQKELDLSYMYITHDLAILRSIANRIAVMYLGKIVELTDADELYQNPKHPYTKALIAATPIPHPRRAREKEGKIILKGDVPSPINPPSGCRFHTRCPHKTDKCAFEEPELIEIEKGHYVACHYLS